MKVDDFAPNLSFFFSNGMDPEYTGDRPRRAAGIWARAMRERYGASPRSQMLKYHVQTSGRACTRRRSSSTTSAPRCRRCTHCSTTATRCHTNAYDEAITTPTEESVRRAVAIQLIINRELG
jgi:methylmalonyl-CoA mutase